MKLFLSSVQWTLFILAGSIVAPISIASMYGLNGIETVEYVQRTLFVLGIAGILQVWKGHRLPIQEGPAGLWWSVITLYAGLGVILYGSHSETLQVIQFAFLLSGLIFLLLGFLGAIQKIANLITPVVVSTYLILLVAQLSSSFLKGMYGLSRGNDSVNLKVLVLSAFIVILSISLSKHPKLGQFSILISLILGWVIFYLFNLSNSIQHVNTFFKIPEIFAFGKPVFKGNMIVLIIVITFLILANMLASIKVVQIVMKKQGVSITEDVYNSSGKMAGIIHLLGGLFSAIGAVPISGSAGFIENTKLTKRMPFIYGSILIILISLISPLTAFVSSIPEGVGYAAIFPVFSSILTLAFKELDAIENKKNAYEIVSVSVFVGVGAMFVPLNSFTSLSPTLSSIFSNGLVFGTIIAVLFEQLLKSRSRRFNK